MSAPKTGRRPRKSRAGPIQNTKAGPPLAVNLPSQIGLKVVQAGPPISGPRFAKEIGDLITGELDKIGSLLAGWIVEHAPKDTETLASSVTHEVKKQGREYSVEVFSTVPYARAALQDGRNPGLKAPPQEILLGWLARRKFTTGQIETVRAFAGRRAGAVFRRRESPGRLEGKFGSILAVTKEYSQTSTQSVRDAFALGRAISNRGIKPPRLFTRAINENRAAIKEMKAAVRSEIIDILIGAK